MKNKTLAAFGLASALVVSTAVTPVTALAAHTADLVRTEMTITKQNNKIATNATNIGEGKAFAQLIPDAQLRAAIYAYGFVDSDKGPLWDPQITIDADGNVTVNGPGTENPNYNGGFLWQRDEQGSGYYDLLDTSDDVNAVKDVLALIVQLPLTRQNGLGITDLTGIKNLVNLRVLDMHADQGAPHAITAIKGKAFQGMKQLAHIHLNGNGLTEIAVDAFVGDFNLADLYIENNNVTNFDALQALKPDCNVKADWDKVTGWENGINDLASKLGVPTKPIVAGNAANAIEFAQFKQELLLKQAVATQNVSQAIAAAGLIVGTGGLKDPAVVNAINALNAAKNSGQYSQVANLLAALTTAVNNYKTEVTKQANAAVNKETVKDGDGKTNVAKARTALKNALKANSANYDQLVQLTAQLNNALAKTTVNKYSVKLATTKTYHLHKYAQGQVKGQKANGATVTATVNGKQIGKTKVKNGKFKLTYKQKLKKNQKIKFSVSRADEAMVVHQTGTTTRKVVVSPKVTATQFVIKKQQVAGKVTAKKGATIKVYKGKKVIKTIKLAKNAKNQTVKFKLKQKYANNAKLKLVVKNTHENGLGTTTVKKIKVQ
ncbi:leucine-rich repeat domain-containing protein [Periweissella cryptocerci]|nr:leucine-rich repeat domain-containing protein [Periweissella cryptocerci]